MSRSILLRLGLAIWLVLVMAVSISPLSFKLRLHTTGVYHNIGHYVVYVITGILFWLITKSAYGKVFAFVLGVALAFGQEWIENKMYHAGFEWKDVGTDLAGLVSGFALMLLVMALADDPGHRT